MAPIDQGMSNGSLYVPNGINRQLVLTRQLVFGRYNPTSFPFSTSRSFNTSLPMDTSIS